MAIHNIDATNQSLGRLATKIAVLLRGKHKATFEPRLMPDEKVIVENINKMKFTGNKLENKVYYHYSGYPGGMKERPLKKLVAQKPAQVLRSTVLNMLPQNRQRAKIIRNLEIK